MVVKLRVPPGCKCISYEGRDLAIDSERSVDVDDDAARILAAHGFSPASSSTFEQGRHEVGLDDVATLNRRGLFSLLRSKGVSVSLPITNEALRTAARKALER
jgi:hypothetical protein